MAKAKAPRALGTVAPNWRGTISINRGFTLIEIFLALLLTAILLAGIYNLFGSQERSQVLVDQMAEMNQNLRVAAITISRDVRMAGYYLEDAQATSGTGGGLPVAAIRVIDGASGAPDTIEVMYGDPSVQTTIRDPMPDPSAELNVNAVCAPGAAGVSVECGSGGLGRCFCENDLIVITDGANSSIFCVTQVQEAALKVQHNPGGGPCSSYNDPGGHGTFPGYGAGSRLLKIQRRVYSIDRSDPDRPRLMVTTGVGLSGAQPLVDYIEDLQVDRDQEDCPDLTNSDPALRRFCPDPTGTVWNNCQAYTISITARTRKPLPGVGGVRRRTVTEKVKVRNIHCPELG